ncbi:MAG: hypothetical protein WDA21_02375 [Bacilli bacterium]
MKKPTVRSNSKYTEDYITVKSISNGMITLDNNLKITGVKIMPRNIFILDQDSQDAILINLKNFYNTIDYEFWIICADRPVDMSVYLSQLQLLYNSTQSPVVRKLVTEDIQKGNSFMQNKVVDTEFYLLFKEKDIDLIQKRIRGLINGLINCGLNSSQVTNDDLRVILDNFLNGGVTTEFGTVMVS